MGASVLEKKMHCPVMTEKHLADRWQVSLKTLRRWRLDNEGPIWHKLFRHVRYHEADILEFERRSAQHLMTLLGINREFKPAEPDATLGQGLDAETDSHYLSAKEIAEAASLPIYLFRDQADQHQVRAAPDAGRQPALLAARDPGVGTGPQRGGQCRWGGHRRSRGISRAISASQALVRACQGTGRRTVQFRAVA